jgi:hypothetical protein
MKKINYSKVRRSAQEDLKKYERFGIKVFREALKLQAKPNPSPLPMQEAYIKFYQKVFVDSAKKEFDRIRQDNQEKAYVPDDFFLNTWREWIKDWVLQNLGTLISGVNDTTLKQIQEILADGIEQGLNPFQLERLLLKQIPNVARARAIARTESTRAYNEGKKKSADDWAKQTGTSLWKIWIHGGAKEPRFQHILAQDKPIRADQPFVFTTKGVEVFMDKPGDIKGGAAQTVNCSCVVVYISEAYARRNFPDTFNNTLPVISSQTIQSQANNDLFNQNQILSDSLIASEQSKTINDKIKTILKYSNGVSENMNKNNSLLAIRTRADKSIEGARAFANRTLGEGEFLATSSYRIGGAMDAREAGNAIMNGKYMNIVFNKDSVVEFKRVNALINNQEIDDLVNNQGYKYSKIKQKTRKDIEVVLDKKGEIIAYKDKNGNFSKWSVGSSSTNKNIAPTITHESAHLMQAFKDLNEFGERGGDEIWQRIFTKNKLTIFDAPTHYGKTNSKEFFAETFAAYVYDNKRLKEMHPKVYDTFLEYLNEIGVDFKTIRIAD